MEVRDPRWVRQNMAGHIYGQGSYSTHLSGLPHLPEIPYLILWQLLGEWLEPIYKRVGVLLRFSAETI